jgi:hypothetical protein
MLLDERGRPDFRDVYGRHASVAATLDAAVRKVRLAGVTLGSREIGGVRRMRVLVAEMNALTLSGEAEAIGADPSRRQRLELLLQLFDEGRLAVRTAPLAGWDPDFTIFGRKKPETLLLGPHWFERPYPHPGPAFGVVLSGDHARRAHARFEGLWSSAHDLRRPIEELIREAFRRTA